MTIDRLRPGSHESRREGCKCDMLRNQYGLGAYVPANGKAIYEIEPKCPIHGDHRGPAEVKDTAGWDAPELSL